MCKELILVSGLSGAMLSSTPDGPLVSIDRYFMKYGKYEFDASELEKALHWCKEEVKKWMEVNERGFSSERIVVANRFVQEREIEDYYKLAEEYGYSVIVETQNK